VDSDVPGAQDPENLVDYHSQDMSLDVSRSASRISQPRSKGSKQPKLRKAGTSKKRKRDDTYKDFTMR